MTETDPNRRPIAARRLRPMQALARVLAARGVTPNAISQASMVFAAFGLAAFWGSTLAGPVGQTALLLLAALAVQGRLVCNLVDGLVAVEGGQATPQGAFWNEAPDRVADTLFLWGAGLAAGWASLGLGCAVLAVATAYLREFGRAEGFSPDFGGPMAKQQRM
ncbi:MAG: CDP-alcohol phosphatidyltransferase family protein, partial [Rhodobacteraceae bacterium]|nr:CDP-alcohol phosphatidyltransferase family protein [Paracoccaceae bacterium]